MTTSMMSSGVRMDTDSLSTADVLRIQDTLVPRPLPIQNVHPCLHEANLCWRLLQVRTNCCATRSNPSCWRADTPTIRESVFFAIAYVFTGIYGILAILLSSAGCHPTQVLTANVNAVCNGNVRRRRHCCHCDRKADHPPQTSRWAALTAMDGLTEITLLAMPIWFISKNELKSSKKRIVVFVYSFR